MEQTNVDDCLLVDGSLDLEETPFSLAEFVIRTQTDSSFAPKTIFLPMSSKLKDKELANENNKQFDPGGKVGEPPLSKVDVLVLFSFSGGCMGSDARLVSFASVYLSVSCCFCFSLQGKTCDRFPATWRKHGRREKANGHTNQVDEEHSRRASIFLPINPLEISTSRLDSPATGWG